MSNSKWRRRSLTGEVMHDERSAYEAMLKAISIKTKVVAQELAWAYSENNANVLTLFSKVAELQHIYAEAERKMAEKYLDLNKSFKNIFQEEKAVEETRKEQQNYLVRVTKIEKQLELARAAGEDATKIENLESDMTGQGNLYGQLTRSVEAKEKKLNVYKASLLKKGLRQQAEGGLAMARCCLEVFQAQMELAELLPSEPNVPTDTNQELEDQMAALVNRVADTLSIASPPPMGGLEPWNVNGRAPQGEYSSLSNNRRSMIVEMEGGVCPRGRREVEDSHYDRKRFSSCSSDGRLDSFGQSSSSWDSFNDAPPLPPPREGEGRYSSLSQSPLLQNVPKTSPPETPPPAPRRQQQQQPPPPPQYEDVPNVYCEVVIPSSNKRGRPELVKSRSESCVNKLTKLPDNRKKQDVEGMTNRLDQRLKQAGLLKPGRPVFADSQPSSSCSSSENILEEPGYARLAVLPAYPTCPINPPFVPPVGKPEDDKIEEEFGEDDYANPVDALRMNKKKVAPGPASKLSLYPPSTPPGSPQPPPESASRLSPETTSQVSPKTSPRRMDPYQSVDDIRMMRDRQLKERGRETEGVKFRKKKDKPKAEARVSQDLDHVCDDETYSRPFDALAAHRKRLPTAPEPSVSSMSLNTAGQFGHGQRSNSAEKLHMNEPSARYLHQVSSNGDPLPTGASSHPVLASQNSNPEDKRVRAKSFGKADKSHKGATQAGGVAEGSAGGVNRYILKLEDKQGDLSRRETGRTCSVGSALNSPTPAKITKLRNGRGRIAILGGKKKDADNNH